MKDSDYLVLDTPELKKLYAPKRATDEVWQHSTQSWSVIANCYCREPTVFDGNSLYRRLRSKCWLEISKVPVQYPAWLKDINDNRRWFDSWEGTESQQHDVWTHWQPDPIGAPAPPVDEDDAAMEVHLNKIYDSAHVFGTQKDLARYWLTLGRDYERSKHDR